MAAIPASALLEQFAEEITPAGQAVLGLNAQPFGDDHGTILGEIYDAGRGNVTVVLARKAALLTECRRLGLSTADTATTLRTTIQRANTHVVVQIAADSTEFTDAELDVNLTDPMGTIDVSAMTFGAALAEILTSVTTAPATDVAAFATASITDQAGLLRLAKLGTARE